MGGLFSKSSAAPKPTPQVDGEKFLKALEMPGVLEACADSIKTLCTLERVNHRVRKAVHHERVWATAFAHRIEVCEALVPPVPAGHLANIRYLGPKATRPYYKTICQGFEIFVTRAEYKDKNRAYSLSAPNQVLLQTTTDFLIGSFPELIEIAEKVEAAIGAAHQTYQAQADRRPQVWQQCVLASLSVVFIGMSTACIGGIGLVIFAEAEVFGASLLESWAVKSIICYHLGKWGFLSGAGGVITGGDVYDSLTTAYGQKKVYQHDLRVITFQSFLNEYRRNQQEAAG